MFDIRQIQYFEAVYRLRSFSQAADEMHLTHAALTKSIKTLEHKWGVPVSPHHTARLEKLFLAEAEALRQTAMREQRHIRLCAALLCSIRWRGDDSRISAETKPPLEGLEDVLERRADLMLIHANTLKALPYGERLMVTPIVDEPYRVICCSGHEIGQPAIGRYYSP